MRRREFFAVMGGAVSWPLPVGAQQSGRVPRIAVISNLNVGDPEFEARHAAFLRGLQEFGWAVGRNVQIDVWSHWVTQTAREELWQKSSRRPRRLSSL